MRSFCILEVATLKITRCCGVSALHFPKIICQSNRSKSPTELFGHLAHCFGFQAQNLFSHHLMSRQQQAALINPLRYLLNTKRWSFVVKPEPNWVQPNLPGLGQAVISQNSLRLESGHVCAHLLVFFSPPLMTHGCFWAVLNVQ